MLTLGAAALLASAAAPRVAPAAGNCTCIPSAKDADLITALGWVCDPNGGKVDCSAINTVRAAAPLALAPLPPAPPLLPA